MQIDERKEILEEEEGNYPDEHCCSAHDDGNGR